MKVIEGKTTNGFKFSIDEKKHIADKNDGFVPSSEMTSTIVDIIKTSRKLKNSSSSEG